MIDLLEFVMTMPLVSKTFRFLYSKPILIVLLIVCIVYGLVVVAAPLLTKGEWSDLTKEFPPKETSFSSPVGVTVDKDNGFYYVGGSYVHYTPVSLKQYINKMVYVKAKYGGYREVLTENSEKPFIYPHGVMALSIESIKEAK